MLRNDVGWTQPRQSPRCVQMPQGTPLIEPIVPAIWDGRTYRRGTLRHLRALLTLWELRPPHAISEHWFTKETFYGLSFLFWGEFVFFRNRRRNSWFLNFFQPKSKTVKTKMDRDQKLWEDARRIFKPFLARFLRCGWLTVLKFQSAATPEPCQKRLKNALRVFS